MKQLHLVANRGLFRQTADMLVLWLRWVVIAMVAATRVAGAHHSAAMFDFQRQVTLTGTVKEFQFNNPHCFIQLLVDDRGTTLEWSVEMGAPAHLLRSGWRPNTLKVGDRISVTVNPVRFGSLGGNFVSGMSSQGTPLGNRP